MATIADLKDAAGQLRDKANDLVTVCTDIENILAVGDGLGGDSVAYAYSIGAAIQAGVISGVQTDIDNAYTALAAISVTPIEVPET
jgi:hypothetical protein